ncbi:hypothetical protein EVAR_55961_1 [Eumeta japonica]|uniref:Uncharacterized protein n=1 Tax=Eumeta variegata TaxID=151549 RepID=A0A4C1YVG9_EUMVA|nr:hypothetical protein EVAR_55961_1 [Eumeta japonica]
MTAPCLRIPFQRKEGYVLSYFVFGIVAAVGLVIEGTLLAAFKVHAPTACTIFLLIAVYVLCLSMVYAVYCNIKLEKGSKQKPFTVLHEDCVDGIKLEEAV